MTTKIVLLLSMSLNVMLAFVVIENNRKPVSLGDFRDSVADIRPSVQPPAPAPAEAAPAEAAPIPAPQPAPAAEAVVVQPAPAAAPAQERPQPAPIVVANDWAAYRQDMADDKDVLVGNLFRSEKKAARAMDAAVTKAYASGRDVLFSCLMPATGGGVFYLIRLVPAAADVPRMASMADVSSRGYVKEVKLITDRTEKEVWGSI